MTRPRTPPPPPPPPPEPHRHEVALWAGAAAFFGTVLAVGAFDLLDINGWAAFLSAIVVAVFTAGAVYSKERLNAAKREEEK